MPLLRTDDGPRSLRNVWLGPRGFTWWWEWSYPRWGVTFLAVNITAPFFLVVFWVVLHPVLGIAAAFICGIPAAVWLGGRLTDGASYDEPLDYQAATWAHETRARFRPADQASAEWTITIPRPGDLSEGAARAIR